MLEIKHNYIKCILFIFLLILLPIISQSKENKYLIHPAPVVNFNISHFCFGDSTILTNTSQLGTTYEWDIYEVVNGAHGTTVDSLIFTSTNFNINYLFQNYGHYIIELTGFNGHTVTLDRDFIIDTVTHANFDYTFCGSKFINTSVCYDHCLWDFGDGATSTLDSPVHFYDSLATWYTIKLTTYNVNSTDIHIDSIYASSINNLNGNFTYKINKDSVLFIASDSISGPFTQYHWSFGDGVVADLTALGGGRKVYHTYVKKDTTYTVFLLAKTTCLNAFSQENVFLVDSTPVNGTYIYPNPVSENTLLSIATDKKELLKDINIIDCLGKLYGTCNIIETFKGFNLDISNLAKGLYFVRLNFNDEIITKKILKE
jgi:PKD repeat protein